MPFAGDMKLTTFLGLGGAAVVVLAVGGSAATWFYLDSLPEPPPPEPAPVVAPAPTPSPSPAPAAAPAAAAPATGRPVDQVVLGYVGKDLGSSKLKDVTKGKPYKVNVYQDDGHATANRAKIDLDRDDKWDEKITFGDDGSISRKVSEADDDQTYDAEYVWGGEDWVAR